MTAVSDTNFREVSALRKCNLNEVSICVKYRSLIRLTVCHPLLSVQVQRTTSPAFTLCLTSMDLPVPSILYAILSVHPIANLPCRERPAKQMKLPCLDWRKVARHSPLWRAACPVTVVKATRYLHRRRRRLVVTAQPCRRSPTITSNLNRLVLTPLTYYFDALGR